MLCIIVTSRCPSRSPLRGVLPATPRGRLGDCLGAGTWAVFGALKNVCAYICGTFMDFCLCAFVLCGCLPEFNRVSTMINATKSTPVTQAHESERTNDQQFETIFTVLRSTS